MLIDLLIFLVAVILLLPAVALVYFLPNIEFPLGGVIVLALLAAAGSVSSFNAYFAPALKEITFGQIMWRLSEWKLRRAGMLGPNSPRR